MTSLPAWPPAGWPGGRVSRRSPRSRPAGRHISAAGCRTEHSGTRARSPSETASSSNSGQTQPVTGWPPGIHNVQC